MPYLLLLIAALLLVAGWRRWHSPAVQRRLLRTLATLLAVLVGLIGAYLVWVRHRPIPQPVQREIAPGIIYHQVIRKSFVAHVANIDLGTPGLHLVVTPPQPVNGYEMTAMTTSTFLRTHACALAINAGFFTPWHADGAFDYYPHAGDGVNIIGHSASAGVVYGLPDIHYHALCIDAHNHAAFDAPHPWWNAVSGRELLLDRGQINPTISAWSAPLERHPRTAVALDKSHWHLLLVVIDGRQGHYSAGATIAELTQLLIDFGSDTALLLDGGGSSTMVMADDTGAPLLLNSPIHGRIPGQERPVANHLGIVIKGPPPTP